MHRIEGVDHINVDGKFLFKEQPPSTKLTSAWLNSVQEEIAYLIEIVGEQLYSSNNDLNNQLVNSLENLSKG